MKLYQLGGFKDGCYIVFVINKRLSITYEKIDRPKHLQDSWYKRRLRIEYGRPYKWTEIIFIQSSKNKFSKKVERRWLK